MMESVVTVLKSSIEEEKDGKVGNGNTNYLRVIQEENEYPQSQKDKI